MPLDLLAHYDGRNEITRALGTSDPKEARVRLAKEWAALDDEFAHARKSGSAVAQSRPVPVAAATTNAAPYVPTWEEVEYDIESAQHSFEISFREDCEYEAREEARQRLLLTLEAHDEFLSVEQRALKDILSDAKLDVETAQMKARTLEIAGAKPPSKAAMQPPASSARKPTGTSFATLVEKWAKERGREGKAARDHLAVTRWLTERTGVETVEALTKQHVLAFKDKMLADGGTPANVNVKLSRLRTLLNFASDNAIVPDSVAAKIRVIDKDSVRNRRKPFDRKSLAAIFGGPVHAAGERPAGGRGEAAYWLPLLALYTGARREELGQLRPGDVREETYLGPDDEERAAWCISIVHDEEAGLKLKNAGSERTIPVHADLLRLGFDRFARKAQNAKQDHLFPELRPNADGRRTEKWGEWFSIYRREVCGVTDPRLVFHSFRHTFKDCARKSVIPDPVQRQLMGHSGGDTADSYGEGYDMHVLVEGMKLYRVPGFKLPPPPE